MKILFVFLDLFSEWPPPDKRKGDLRMKTSTFLAFSGLALKHQILNTFHNNKTVQQNSLDNKLQIYNGGLFIFSIKGLNKNNDVNFIQIR